MLFMYFSVLNFHCPSFIVFFVSLEKETEVEKSKHKTWRESVSSLGIKLGIERINSLLL